MHLPFRLLNIQLNGLQLASQPLILTNLQTVNLATDFGQLILDLAVRGHRFIHASLRTGFIQDPARRLEFRGGTGGQRREETDCSLKCQGESCSAEETLVLAKAAGLIIAVGKLEATRRPPGSGMWSE